MCNGKMLPATNLIDMFGVQTGNPLHAFSAIAYDFEEGGWIAVECKPGDVYPSRSISYAEPFCERPTDRHH